MIILAVDLGKARTGLAICDKNEILASPLDVIKDKNTDNVLKKIIEYAKEHNVEKIVIGLPKNMDGSEGESAKNSREFAKKLEEQSLIEVQLLDERQTTKIANNYLNNTKTYGKKRKDIIDTVAAVIILQDYIDNKNYNT